MTRHPVTASKRNGYCMMIGTIIATITKFIRNSSPIIGISVVGLVLFFSNAYADDNYGAIAYSSSTGEWGYAYNYPSRAAAESSALRRCGKGDCRIKVWFVNACGALAVGRDGVLGWGWGDSRSEAESIALGECSAKGSGCEIRCWACTDR